MKSVWVKKHAPKSISDIVFANDKMRKEFQIFSSDKEFPNLLLCGHPGTGKSSISNALVHDCGIDAMDHLRINCSNKKIEAMRDEVANFARTMPLGKFKVVQLEEFDRLSPDAQGLLNAVIEDSSDTCRFIATCNYPNKILPALHSRLTRYNFAAPNKDEVLIRTAEILEKEGVSFDIDDLEQVVAAGYPDIRKIICLLEVGSKTKQLIIGSDNGGVSDWKLDLLPLIEAGNISACRKLVCESADSDELVDVYRFLYDNLHRCKKIKQDEAVVLIAQYQYQHAFVSDPELQVAALFVELGTLV